MHESPGVPQIVGMLCRTWFMGLKRGIRQVQYAPWWAPERHSNAKNGAVARFRGSCSEKYARYGAAGAGFCWV